MRVAVIGRGNIGGTIGRKLAAAGHDVVFGARDPKSGDVGGELTVADIPTALDGADAVLLALPARGVDDFLTAHGSRLDGKLVVDATNNIGAPVANASAAISAATPSARYARAFNCLGWENFADPDFDGQPADLFYSSSDADRGQIEELIKSVGLRPVFLGADRAEAVDSVLPVWFALIQANGGNRHVAFRVLEK
jgi:hypothetical protein